MKTGQIGSSTLEAKATTYNIIEEISSSGAGFGTLAGLDTALNNSTNGWVMYDCETGWDWCVPDRDALVSYIRKVGAKVHAEGFKVVMACYGGWPTMDPSSLYVPYSRIASAQAKYGDMIVAQASYENQCQDSWVKQMKFTANLGKPVIANQITNYGCVDTGWAKVKSFTEGHWVWTLGPGDYKLARI